MKKGKEYSSSILISSSKESKMDILSNTFVLLVILLSLLQEKINQISRGFNSDIEIKILDAKSELDSLVSQSHVKFTNKVESLHNYLLPSRALRAIIKTENLRDRVKTCWKLREEHDTPKRCSKGIRERHDGLKGHFASHRGWGIQIGRAHV